MEGSKYYYKANQIQQLGLEKVRAFSQIQKLDISDNNQRFEEMVQQLSNQFVLVKHTLEQQAYKNYTMLEIKGERAAPFKMPPGIKPILIYKDVALIKKKQENDYKIGILKYKHQGVTATSVLELGFSPKMTLNLDSIKEDSGSTHLMLIGKNSLDDFAIVKLQEDSMALLKKSGAPNSLLKILFQDKPQQRSTMQQFLTVQGIEVLEHEQSPKQQTDTQTSQQNQKLVIMNIYNSQSDQYCLYTMLLLHKKSQGLPSWEFVLTDQYVLKPGKILHSLTLSHFHQKEIQEGFNQNFCKVIVAYDCSKLVEIMLNTNPKYLSDSKEKPKFIRKVTKLKHQLNFAKISQCFKLQGSQEFVVQDLHKRLYKQLRQMSFVSILRPQRKIAKSSRLSEIQDEAELQFKGDQNLLLFEGQEMGETINFLVPLSETILVLHAQKNQVCVNSIVRVSVNELIQHYLETKNDLMTAQKIMDTHGLEDSTLILEYQLKQKNYQDQRLLAKFLAQNLKVLEGSKDISEYDNVFKKLTHIILKQKVDSLQSIQILVDNCQKVLLDKMIAAGKQNEDDLLFLRQLLWYQKRLTLFTKLQDLNGVRFQTFQVEDSPQKFMLDADFVGSICNQILYQNISDIDQDECYRQILKLIVDLNYHEVTLNFEGFLSIISFEKLSLDLINQLLPSNDKMSQFWINIKSICSDSEAQEYFQKTKQIELHMNVALELLNEANQPELALQLVKGGIELKGLSSQEMCQLGIQCVQSCDRILPDQHFNSQDVMIPLEGIKLLSFRSTESPLDAYQTLEIIEKYFNESKFVFHRDRDLYKNYLKQLRYFTSLIIDPSLRQEFLVGLLRSQGSRTNQFTIDDADLVQVVLDLIFSPTFQPQISDARSLVIDMSDEKIKFMKFVPETIEFIESEVVPMLCLDVDQQFDDQLMPSENQKQLIQDHLLKHLKIGQLEFMSKVWLVQSSNEQSHKQESILDFDQNNLRFVDLLKLQNQQNPKWVQNWIENILDLQIKLSRRKREALKTLKTQVTTSLFDMASSGIGGLFQQEQSQGQQTQQQEQKWTQLFDQISLMVSLLNHQESIEFSQLFINKMLHSGNFQAMREIMSKSSSDPSFGSEKQNLKSQIGEVVLKDIQDKFNDLQFSDKKSNTSNDNVDQAQADLLAFYQFRQKSQEFLNILIKESDDEEFRKKCHQELSLLDATEQLVKSKLLFSVIPVTQVREDWASNQLLRRVFQIHGLKDLTLSNQDQDVSKLLKSFGKLVQPLGDLKLSQIVIFEVLMFMSENRLFNDRDLNMIMKEQVENLIIDEMSFEQLESTKFEKEIQKILIEMLKSDIASQKADSVAPPPDDFGKKLSKFLITSSDKSQISSDDLNHICSSYIEHHSRRPKQNIKNLVLALQTRKEHKALSMMNQDFECLLKDLQPFKLPYSDIKFMLKIMQPQTELQSNLRDLIKRKKRTTQDFAGLILDFQQNGNQEEQPTLNGPKRASIELMLKDSESLEDQILQQLNQNCLKLDSQDLCPIKVGEYLDSFEDISKEIVTISLKAISDKPSEEALSEILILTKRLGISLLPLIQFLFPKSSNMDIELAQNKLKQSKYLRFLISKLGLKSYQNLLLIELYNKVDTANVYALLELFTEIDQLGAKQTMGLCNMCVLAIYLSNCYGVVRYKREPNIQIQCLIDFVECTEDMTRVIQKANSTLTEEFQIENNYLIQPN